MSNVTPIAPQLDIRVPDELRPLKAWVIWRLERRPGEDKPRKVPYYAGGGRRSGRQGTDADRSKLVTADAALAAARRKGFDGIGYCALPELPYVAIDYDNVVQDPGTLDQVKLQVAGTYAEFSPSGNGVRAFVKRVPALDNIKSHAKEGHAFTFEVFATSGFVTFTGNALPDLDLTGADNYVDEPQPALLQLYADRLAARRKILGERTIDNGGAEPVGYGHEQIREMLSMVSASCSYQEWINVGMAVHHETEGEGFDLWHDWSASSEDYVSEQDCLGHWASFGQRGSGPVITIRSLLGKVRDAGAAVPGTVATADDFEVIEDSPEELAVKAERRRRFSFMSAAEFAAQELPGWVVDDLIPKADLVVVYGASTGGKSFVMIDLSMAIARGVAWRGLDVEQGRVAYICAEGGGGFRKRLRAYSQHHQVDLAGVPFEVMGATPNFLMKDDVGDVRHAIEALQGVKVIVVDTWAKVTAGANENAGEDMGRALDNCRLVAAGTGAVVILVHHTGKDVERGARGWSGLRAAADAEFEVIHDETKGKRWLQTTKQKDGDGDGRWGFKLEEIVIGVTNKGKEITSCVILEDEAPANGRRKGNTPKKLKPWPSAVMEAFQELALKGGMIKVPELVEAAAAKRPEAGELRHRKSNAKRALEGLARGKDAMLIIEKAGDLAVVVEAQD